MFDVFGSNERLKNAENLMRGKAIQGLKVDSEGLVIEVAEGLVLRVSSPVGLLGVEIGRYGMKSAGIQNLVEEITSSLSESQLEELLNGLGINKKAPEPEKSEVKVTPFTIHVKRQENPVTYTRDTLKDAMDAVWKDMADNNAQPVCIVQGENVWSYNDMREFWEKKGLL